MIRFDVATARRFHAKRRHCRAPARCPRRSDVRAPLPRACACDTRAVTTFDALGSELQSTWLREIPLAASLAIEVAACARDELAVRAPLAPNRNLHGTAFAGSVFSVCVLTGWGAAWLALAQRGIEGLIVVSESRIQ